MKLLLVLSYCPANFWFKQHGVDEVIILKKIYTLLKIILRPVRAFFFSLYYTYLIKHEKSSFILTEVWILIRNNKMYHRNWGDDLNFYFFRAVSNLKVLNIPYTKMNNKHFNDVYSLIGSIMGLYNLDNKIIFGTGVMDPSLDLKGIPKKIISVRGPKTREVLLKNNIFCPENYGDPALLLPCIYKYEGVKHNRPVIIPNMGTFETDYAIVKELSQSLNAIILDLTKYDRWTDPIDTIVGASFVISESLHGLIVAETYGIPNVWVDFISHPDYWDFKFEDYYESIGKRESIIQIRQLDDYIKANDKLKNWKRGNIDYDLLKSFYPFKANWIN